MFVNSPFAIAGIDQLTEPTSIALASQIQRQEILTPLSETPIGTTYVQQGTADPPILMLHGFDTSVLEFRRIIPLLAAEHQTWAIDQLGFGFTDRPVGFPFSPLAIKTHLYYTWKTLIQRPVILIGVSMGGAAAIDFALTHPECVSRLVLIDSAGFRGGAAPRWLMVPPIDRWATNFLQNPKVRQQISRNAYRDLNFASVDADCCASLHLTQPGWSQALIAFTKSGGYGSYRQHLHKITQPTLILWGEHDRILGTKDAVGLHKAIPQSQLIWIPNCGHVPHLERPDITAQHILDWLK